jgi:hypothetical protein
VLAADFDGDAHVDLAGGNGLYIGVLLHGCP